MNAIRWSRRHAYNMTRSRFFAHVNVNTGISYQYPHQHQHRSVHTNSPNNGNGPRSITQGGPGGTDPPSNNFTLPTIDASPILDPTLYIKKSAKASHTIAGCDAAKRLLSAQHKVRSWIWTRTRKFDRNRNRNGDSYDNTHTDLECQFGLVGHGVPYQLLQDHVDCAWGLLSQLQDEKLQNDQDDVVECNFCSETGRLDFDWIKIRKRNGSTFNLSSNNTSNAQYLLNLLQPLTLYLTVMNRISCTFGTILQTQPTHESYKSSLSVTTEKYWKKDIPTPIKYWRTTFKRGFVYPPSRSASAAVFAHFHLDVNEMNYGRDFWTGPPIVELIPGTINDGKKNGDGRIASAEDDDSDAAADGAHNHDSNTATAAGRKSNPSMVRVTLQGIPTVFWKDRNSSTSMEGSEDMVPVSLVFEGCFEGEAHDEGNDNDGGGTGSKSD